MKREHACERLENHQLRLNIPPQRLESRSDGEVEHRVRPAVKNERVLGGRGEVLFEHGLLHPTLGVGPGGGDHSWGSEAKASQGISGGKGKRQRRGQREREEAKDGKNQEEEGTQLTQRMPQLVPPLVTLEVELKLLAAEDVIVALVAVDNPHLRVGVGRILEDGPEDLEDGRDA